MMPCSPIRSTDQDSPTVRRITAVLEKPMQKAPLLHVFIDEVEGLYGGTKYLSLGEVFVGHSTYFCLP